MVNNFFFEYKNHSNMNKDNERWGSGRFYFYGVMFVRDGKIES